MLASVTSLTSLILTGVASLALLLPALAVEDQAGPTCKDLNGFPPELLGKRGAILFDGQDVGSIPIQIISPADPNWHPFLFTNAGSYGSPRFQVTTTQAFAPWQATDYYCAGDQFQIFVTRVSTNSTTSTNTFLPAYGASCANYTTDPATAYANIHQVWSTTKGALGPADTYIFTFYTLLSPFSAGKAAFRMGSS